MLITGIVPKQIDALKPHVDGIDNSFDLLGVRHVADVGLEIERPRAQFLFQRRVGVLEAVHGLIERGDASAPTGKVNATVYAVSIDRTF